VPPVGPRIPGSVRTTLSGGFSGSWRWGGACASSSARWETGSTGVSGAGSPWASTNWDISCWCPSACSPGWRGGPSSSWPSPPLRPSSSTDRGTRWGSASDWSGWERRWWRWGPTWGTPGPGPCNWSPPSRESPSTTGNGCWGGWGCWSRTCSWGACATSAGWCSWRRHSSWEW